MITGCRAARLAVYLEYYSPPRPAAGKTWKFRMRFSGHDFTLKWDSYRSTKYGRIYAILSGSTGIEVLCIYARFFM
jgi:hypothetical protein